MAILITLVLIFSVIFFGIKLLIKVKPIVEIKQTQEFRSKPKSKPKAQISPSANVIKLKVRINFDYVNNEGEPSNRTVQTTLFAESYLKGYCELREEFRTFTLSKMSSICNADTGEAIEDIFSFVKDKAS